MNTRTHQKQSSPSPTTPNPAPLRIGPTTEHEYGELATPESIVEHLSVAGFLRRIPQRWHMQDINRFGDTLGKAAEALHLAYLTRVDSSLGVVRVFPLPLLRRVYETLAPQFGWPQIMEGELVEDPARAQLRTLITNQKMDRFLKQMMDAADTEDVRNSIAHVREHLEAQCQVIRQSQVPEEAAGA